jgi:hypothetical protein
MSLWRDEKFLRLLAPALPRFTQKTAHTFNFRCPLCGDSQTNKHKARGYVFPKADMLLYKCHNCSVSMPFSTFLKSQSRHLYDEYILERLKEQGRQQPNEFARSDRERLPEPITLPPVRHLAPALAYPLSSLTHAHPRLHLVYAFAKDVRKLPISAFDRLYATNDANRWLLPLVGDEKAKRVSDDIPYLVQPFRMPDGEWYGAQLRMVDRKEFTTFRWAHEPLKVFGLEAWSPDKLTLIVEGPIDSLFLPNALSPCGSDLLSGMRCLEDADILKPSHPRVYIWDNEPRNKEIVKHIRMAIKLKENVVVWPRQFPKDINDMVRAGLDVLNTIHNRTFYGLQAELAVSEWLKP